MVLSIIGIKACSWGGTIRGEMTRARVKLLLHNGKTFGLCVCHARPGQTDDCNVRPLY